MKIRILEKGKHIGLLETQNKFAPDVRHVRSTILQTNERVILLDAEVLSLDLL